MKKPNLLAFIWGLAESTLFFFLPDVIITRIALEGYRKGFVSCFYALAGALIGGSIMFIWGSNNLPGARTILDHIPAISIGMMDKVQKNISHEGVVAILKGPFLGIPYKIYAIHSFNSGVGYLAFIMISIPARLTRFFILTSFFSWLSTSPLKNWSMKNKTILVYMFWIAIYTLYFSKMPN